MIRTFPIFFALSLCIGCASSTVRVNTTTDTEVTVGYSYEDIDNAITQVVNSLLAADNLAISGRASPVVAIGRVVNDTCQDVDTMLLTERIAGSLLETGRFSISGIFAAKAAGRDDMVMQVRNARNNDEFDQASIHAKGLLQASDFSLTGKLVQQNIRKDDGGLRVEYHLQMSMTRLHDGVKVWTKTHRCIKEVSEGRPVW